MGFLPLGPSDHGLDNQRREEGNIFPCQILTQRQRQRQTLIQSETSPGKEKDRKRQRQKKTKTEREFQIERQSERQTRIQTQRQTQRQRQTQTQRQRQGQWQRLVQSKDHFFASGSVRADSGPHNQKKDSQLPFVHFFQFQIISFFHSQLPGMKTERTSGRSEEAGITSGF